MGIKNGYNIIGIYQGCSGALICRKEDFQVVQGYNPEVTVREHRKLILQLKAKGKYHCLDTYVTTSMRRFQQWGLGKSVLFWSKQCVKDKFKILSSSKYEVVR